LLREALVKDGFDAVLAHMVPRYALLAERRARACGAGLFLWYTHAGVDQRLRKAVTIVDKVFTASAESLRVETPARVITGHGIDLEHFPLASVQERVPLRLLSVGRLTPAKDPLTVLAALAVLRRAGVPATLQWIGGTMTAADRSYEDAVRARTREWSLEGCVEWCGAMPWRTIPAHYRQADLLVNASHTGSVDKVVLEAMASGTPVLSCNESIPRVLETLGTAREGLLFAPRDADDLALKARELLEMSQPARARLGGELRAIVARDHEVGALMRRLVAEMRQGRSVP
jgi:glycosyltransferase involved in cell wall biosynthesis